MTNSISKAVGALALLASAVQAKTPARSMTPLPPAASHTVSAPRPPTSQVQAPSPVPTWSFEYDGEGALTQVIDGNGAAFRIKLDSLGRRTLITQPAPTPTGTTPTIGLQYDLRDQLTGVTDPRALSTRYAPDGFGDDADQVGPDTGELVRTFYDNGWLRTSKDARGHVTQYTYDELGRIDAITYDDGQASRFTYDETDTNTPGIGKLTTIRDESGQTHWGYDYFGHVTTKVQTVGPSNKVFTVRYGYGDRGPAANQLQTLTYPSGAVVSYTYGNATRLSDVAVTAQGVTVTILSGMTYTGLNQPKTWTWGTGNVTVQRSFDDFGRLVGYPLGDPNAADPKARGVTRTLGFDAAGRITAYAHTQPGGLDQRFGYDNLDRLTQASTNGGHRYGYGYDATGNRTSRTVDDTSYPLTVSPTSNRLTDVQAPTGGGARGYDDAGNLTSDPSGRYAYSARGRLASVTRASLTVSYRYNALEQRVLKTGPNERVPTGAAYYVYDEAGHLLGEYDASGNPIYETVYSGDLPVAVLTTAGGAMRVSYVYADHLNTPRVIARASDHEIVWTWGSDEPFGQAQANGSPNGLETFVYNPRFPGQMADMESGWYYNGRRDYDPATGRYTESDPIGLQGGINTYAYVGAYPLNAIDVHGLVVQICRRAADLPPPLNLVDHQWVKTDTTEAGMGAQAGVIPAQGGNSDMPFTPTQVVDHTGQSKKPNAICEPVKPKVDEPCVNKQLELGRKTGLWSPWNQCHTFVQDVIAKCTVGAEPPAPVEPWLGFP